VPSPELRPEIPAMGDTTLPTRFVLRRLPLSARLSVTVFLLSVGLGYLAALVQLHYQHAQKGQLLPTGADSVKIFHGDTGRPITKFEKMLDADPNEGFGSKSMRAGFTNDSSARKAKEAGNQKLLDEREGERLAVLAWLRDGGKEDPWVKDRFVLPDDWKKDQ